MKRAREILDEKFPHDVDNFFDDEGVVETIIQAMEEYAQYKVDELNKSDVIKSICVCNEQSIMFEQGLKVCGNCNACIE